MSDLEFMCGICQSVLNPLPEEDEEYHSPYEYPLPEEEEDHPGYEKEYIITPNNEQLIRYRKWGF